MPQDLRLGPRRYVVIPPQNLRDAEGEPLLSPAAYVGPHTRPLQESESEGPWNISQYMGLRALEAEPSQAG